MKVGFNCFYGGLLQYNNLNSLIRRLHYYTRANLSTLVDLIRSYQAGTPDRRRGTNTVRVPLKIDPFIAGASYRAAKLTASVPKRSPAAPDFDIRELIHYLTTPLNQAAKPSNSVGQAHTAFARLEIQRSAFFTHPCQRLRPEIGDR